MNIFQKTISKVIPNDPAYMTTNKEKLSYWTYFIGQNMFYFIVVSYLTTYMLFLGINPAHAATVMLVVKIWDAVNDPLFGLIFDKVKFKSGKKCLPWVRVSTGLIPIATVLLYIIPASASESVKLWWFALAYLLYDTFYTMCDVPVYSMVLTMTDNLQERNFLMSWRKLFSNGGMALNSVICTVLVSEKVGLGFGPIAIIVSVIGVLFMLPICKNGKEKNYHAELEEESFTLSAMMKYLLHNKYLLIYYIGYFCTKALETGGGMALFVSYYLFGSANFNLMLGVLSAAPTIIASVIMPYLTKRFDKFKMLFVCNLVNCGIGLVIFFMGWTHVVFFIILSVVRAAFSGIVDTLGFMFTPDCAEYGQYKTGVDAKGISFAIQTFTVKIASAVATSLGLFILTRFDWTEINAASFAEVKALGITQSATALNGLWTIYILVPTIGMALTTVCYLFYKLRDKDVQIMAECNAGKITREEAEQLLSRKY